MMYSGEAGKSGENGRPCMKLPISHVMQQKGADQKPFKYEEDLHITDCFREIHFKKYSNLAKATI